MLRFQRWRETPLPVRLNPGCNQDDLKLALTKLPDA